MPVVSWGWHLAWTFFSCLGTWASYRYGYWHGRRVQLQEDAEQLRRSGLAASVGKLGTDIQGALDKVATVEATSSDNRAAIEELKGAGAAEPAPQARSIGSAGSTKRT